MGRANLSRPVTTNLDITGRDCALVLRMDPAERDVCRTEGSQQLLEPDGVMKITKVLRDYFAPDALYSVYQEVARFFAF